MGKPLSTLRSRRSRSPASPVIENAMTLDLTGQAFERLTVIEIVSRGHDTLWRCRCECGQETTASTSDLRRGRRKSCGCLRLEKAITHGQTRHGRKPREYAAWEQMFQRCENSRNDRYRHYGGRGIRVCEQWRDYAAFFSDVGPCPDGYSLDRINNDGNYEPGNVRWATWAEQRRNTSKNHRVTFQGETLCLADWAKRLGFKHQSCLTRRLQRGWSVERTLTT